MKRRFKGVYARMSLSDKGRRACQQFPLSAAPEHLTRFLSQPKSGLAFLVKPKAYERAFTFKQPGDRQSFPMHASYELLCRAQRLNG